MEWPSGSRDRVCIGGGELDDTNSQLHQTMTFKSRTGLKSSSQRRDNRVLQQQSWKINDQRFDDIQKTAFKSTRLSKILEIQATEESPDFVGIQDYSAE